MDHNSIAAPTMETINKTAEILALVLTSLFNLRLDPIRDNPKSQNANPKQMATTWALEYPESSI